MSEYHHRLAGLEKLLQALRYMGSAEQLCMRWLVVIVCHHRDAVCTMHLPHTLTTDVTNYLDQQTANQWVHLDEVLLLVVSAAASLTASAKHHTNVHKHKFKSQAQNCKKHSMFIIWLHIHVYRMKRWYIPFCSLFKLWTYWCHWTLTDILKLSPRCDIVSSSTDSQ